MKNLIIISIVFLSICLLDACKEKAQSGEKPAPIVEYTVTPIHGGATITYSMPRDRNILYVMAEYVRNGKTFTARSSAYNNSMTIEGFDTMEPVSATLYTVSDGEIKSDPITVTFEPLESLISLAYNSTVIIPTFGGIRISWENISKTELGMFCVVDSLGTLLEKDVYFSSLESVVHSVRGFEPVETSFIITYLDKWGNTSEPFLFTGTPLLEIEVPKPWKDIRNLIPYDNVSELENYSFSKIWDGIIGVNNRYLSMNGSAGSSMTFDFGEVVKLSRMAMWPTIVGGRPVAEDVFGQVHVLEYEMWGCEELDNSKLSDLPYWLHPISAAKTSQELPDHTFMDDWVYLGRYAVERIDLMGASDADIRERGENGHHFDIPLECEPVRYIRFFPISTATGSPPGNNYWQIGELSFWGQIIPQD